MYLSRNLEILLVDDSPADVGLVEEAFKSWRLPNNLSIAEDGEQAIRFLRRDPPYQFAPRPDLILLDLNLPKKHGREVLAVIKQDEKLKLIPVVVLTTSDAEEDVTRAYQLHANCYVTKPLEIEEFLRRMRRIEDFWLATVRLPLRPSA